MVLTTAAFRRRGLATGNLRWAIERCRERGLIAGLDATPDGVEVYRPLGFQDVCGLQRLRAEQPGAQQLPRRDVAIRPLQAARDLDAIARLDARVFGADRRRLLGYLSRSQPRRALLAEAEGELAGFVLARAGRVALHIGPLVAQSANVAAPPARPGAGRRGGTGLDRRPGPPEPTSSRCCRAPGFEPVRPFTRMVRARPRGSATWRTASRSPAPSSADRAPAPLLRCSTTEQQRPINCRGSWIFRNAALQQRGWKSDPRQPLSPWHRSGRRNVLRRTLERIETWLPAPAPRRADPHRLAPSRDQVAAAAQTERQLMACSDRVLADIGIAREDIPLVARGRDPLEHEAGLGRSGWLAGLLAWLEAARDERRELRRIRRELASLQRPRPRRPRHPAQRHPGARQERCPPSPPA